MDLDYRALSGIVRLFSEWYSSGKHRVTTSVISNMLLTVLTQAPEGHKLLLFLLLHTIRSIIRLLVIAGWAAQVDKLRLACLCSVFFTAALHQKSSHTRIPVICSSYCFLHTVSTYLYHWTILLQTYLIHEGKGCFP